MVPEIYFHVGLGKVASTYLQHRIFPVLSGIDYIPTGKYRKSKRIIPGMKGKKILVSREFDRQFSDEVTWFTSTYPDARIIVLFRRHDTWIASQYKRHVKNGFQKDFKAFFDLDHDQGFWKQKDLFFYPKLETIERCSTQKPLVLFHDELKENPWAFLDKMTSYMGCTYESERVSLEKVHRSYSDRQLKVLRAFCRKFLNDMPRNFDNKVRHWLQYRPWWAFFHVLLYASELFPESWVPEAPLIDPRELDRVRDAYAADWNRVNTYAIENNLVEEMT